MATMLSRLGATVIISSRKQDVLDKTSQQITAEVRGGWGGWGEERSEAMSKRLSARSI